MFESDGGVLGYAYASAHRARLAYQWCVDVSVYIDCRAHHRGVGRALYTALFELLKRQATRTCMLASRCRTRRASACIAPWVSCRSAMHQRIGFKFDRWHDVAWLHLRLADDPQPLLGPRPVRELLRQPDVLTMLDACAGGVRLR